jgi:threonine/homoserine/homoserine lactone efflux protein
MVIAGGAVMYYILFLKCIASGFFLAAPIGPVNLICIRRTLNEGQLSGLIIGLGAAAADALYGYAAAAGLHVLTAFIFHYSLVFRWLGGSFIIYLGYKIFYAIPQNPNGRKIPVNSRYRLFTGIFLLTLTNPITVFTFIAVFSSFGIAVLVTDFFAATLASLGVFIGSSLWWLTLTSIVYRFRHRVTPPIIIRINQIAGLIIILLGIASIMGL